jgi:putative transposase
MDWPYAPKHWLLEPGIYMVTASTYGKVAHLHSATRLDLVLEGLFSVAAEFGWQLRAWAVLSNHYHFIAISPDKPETLTRLLGKLHMTTAKALNAWDGTPGRKVWFQFRDTHLTYERSYLCRLNYVHHNPVHHGVVGNAENYRWCSVAWFAQNAPAAFVKTVKSFPVDQLRAEDDF